jgi:hypothetical protein
LSSSYRGQVLAGRYRLEERTYTTPDASVWRAVDATLDRRVSVRVMRPGHPFAADVSDAARRAALIDDPRLVRVLDVGSDGNAGFVVSEYLDGDSLATLVERSPLAAPVVRRIIGEVSQGLDVAAGRGLHHLRLTPRSVIVGLDGSVKIAGTAVEAAASGLEPDHAATASRVDAVALVALLYSGLTGRWPLGDAGFPPAPRGEGGAPVPPADLVPGVPNDLDTLCVVTLGSQDDGPRSPAALVEQLTPWPTPAEAPLRAAARPKPRTGTPATPSSALTMRGRASSSKRSPAPAAPLIVPGFEVPPGPAAAQPGQPGHADQGTPVDPQTGKPPASPRRSAALFPTPSVALTGSLPIPNEPATNRPRRMDSLFSSPPPPGNPPPAADPATDRTQPRATPPRATPPPSRPASRPTAPPSPAYSSGNRPIERVAPPPGSNFAARNGGNVPTEPLVPWGTTWPTSNAEPPSRLESTGPFPVVIPPEAPPREQSRKVIFGVLAVLVVVLAFAAFELRNFGSSSGTVTPQGAAIPTSVVTTAPVVVATTAEAVTTPPATPTPTPTPTAAAAPPKVASIRAIDPQGDGDESSDLAALAIDGDPATFWKSDSYHSAEFGGLKKGVGLALKLKKSTAVQSAIIIVHGVGGSVQLRTGDSTDLASSTVVGKAQIKNGEAVVQATATSKAKYVILWFTKLPSVGGKYKIEVSEVRLK